MKKVTIGMLAFVSIFFVNSLFAQSIDQGKKCIYYERYKSAKDIFQKILTANPANEEATYWLGQSIILSDDRTKQDLLDAKKIYQSALSSMPSSTLLMAGIGHIELIEGKIQDARNHFEAAISLSQGKSIAVLNAIGFANGNPESKNGDPIYAIEKLKQATQLKKFNSPDVLVNLGDAYRKNGDGGNAILSYQAALTMDPQYARASFRIGRLYQSQGKGQEFIFMEQYNNTIASDPKFAPVYSNLFNYYYETDVPKAAEYFEKWLANADDDPRVCYYRASLKYAQGLFLETITKVNECVQSEGSTPYPSLFRLMGLTYNRLKDSVKAKENFEEYFKRQLSEKVTPGDYNLYADVLLKFPGNEVQAGLLIDKAVALDSVEQNKVLYIKTMTSMYEGQKKYTSAADWYKKIIESKKNPGKTDFYNAGYNYFRGGANDSSITIFNQYTQKYPEDMFGYYMIGKATAAIDSAGILGLAAPFYQKAIELGEKSSDREKVKNQLIGAYKYFIEYYYNVKKDQEMALAYLDKAIALDPSDAQLVSNREFISKNNPKSAPKKPVATKPKSGSSPKKK